MAADVGEPDVDQGEARLALPDRIQTLGTGGRLDHFEPRVPQDAGPGVTPGRVVVDDDDPRGSGSDSDAHHAFPLVPVDSPTSA